MPPFGPCPRTVTITIHGGTIQAVPPRVIIDRDCQLIRWNLVTDGSGTFDANPIVFPWPVPPGVPPPPCGTFSQWTGTVSKTGPNQYLGDAAAPVPDGAVCYKYDVLWSGGVFDPEIQNDPYPPKIAKDKKDKDDKEKDSAD